MSHSDTVTDGDGIEFVGHAPCRTDLIADDLTDFIQMAVPGGDIGVRVAYADKRTLYLFCFDSGCVHQGTVRSPFQS